jgi:hypothetical protein
VGFWETRWSDLLSLALSRLWVEIDMIFKAILLSALALACACSLLTAAGAAEVQCVVYYHVADAKSSEDQARGQRLWPSGADPQAQVVGRLRSLVKSLMVTIKRWLVLSGLTIRSFGRSALTRLAGTLLRP